MDGPCYAVLVHGRGPAVGGTGFEMSENLEDVSTDVAIENNDIRNIRCYTNEVPLAIVDDAPVHDARGAVLQLVNTLRNERIGHDEDGKYTGNVLLDAQIMVGKAILDGTLQPTHILQTATNGVPEHVIEWAEDKVSGNHVNLKEGVGDDQKDAWCKLRVRLHSQDANNIITSSNEFVQGVFWEEPDEERRRRRRRLGGSSFPENHPVPVSDEDGEWRSEWEVGSLPGGCPMRH